MIYLWAFGVLFLFVTVMLGVGVFVEATVSIINKSNWKENTKNKPLFNISILQFTMLTFIPSCLTSYSMPAVNKRKIVMGNREILYPEFTPFNPSNDWSPWATFGFSILTGLIAALIGVICLWLIRSMLPEKFKNYITWKKEES